MSRCGVIWCVWSVGLSVWCGPRVWGVYMACCMMCMCYLFVEVFAFMVYVVGGCEMFDFSGRVV